MQTIYTIFDSALGAIYVSEEIDDDLILHSTDKIRSVVRFAPRQDSNKKGELEGRWFALSPAEAFKQNLVFESEHDAVQWLIQSQLNTDPALKVVTSRVNKKKSRGKK